MRLRRPFGTFIAALSVGIFDAGFVHAFCRTTTCDTCVMPADGCVTDGYPLYWPVTCASYDVQQSASKFADFATANVIADVAFNSWKNAMCPGSGVHPSIELQN